MTNFQIPIINEVSIINDSIFEKCKIAMTEEPKKVFDLESRTLTFAQKTRDFLRRHKKDFADREYSEQLARSSSSVGANYIEATEALSKKDFLMRIKICRKEAKESHYWLHLIDIQDGQLYSEKEWLESEAKQLLLIFNAIIQKSSNND